MLEADESLIVIFSVCDSASKYWDKFTEKSLMGLRSNLKYRTSYLAVYDTDNERLIEKYDASNKELIYSCNFIIPDCDCYMPKEMETTGLKCVNVTLSSKAWEWNKRTGEYKCWSRILIGNVDYSKNKTGLNVVVFKKTEGCVVDSFHVNLHGDEKLTILR